MITEDYVSFETAKLLKEKGFNWVESPFYSEQDRDEWRQNNNYTIPNTSYNPDLPFDCETITLIAPHVSLQMAMKWLREVHHRYVEICTEESIIIKGISSLKSYDLKDLKKEIVFRPAIYDKELDCLWESDIYKTYEEACEAAIKYCLENLI